MKFKIKKETKTYKQLLEFRKKMASVKDEAIKIVESVGGKRFCHDQASLWGGISAIEFDTKPEGWRMVGDRWQHLYIPKANQKELWKKIAALPTIPYKELNDIVKFNAPQTPPRERGIGWVDTVGISFGKDYILINIAEGCNHPTTKVCGL